MGRIRGWQQMAQGRLGIDRRAARVTCIGSRLGGQQQRFANVQTGLRIDSLALGVPQASLHVLQRLGGLAGGKGCAGAKRKQPAPGRVNITACALQDAFGLIQGKKRSVVIAQRKFDFGHRKQEQACRVGLVLAQMSVKAGGIGDSDASRVGLTRGREGLTKRD